MQKIIGIFRDSFQDLSSSLTGKWYSTRMAYVYLLAILLITLFIRLLTIDTPHLDRTFWKEIDYIQISENYYRNGYNFFEPEISWPADKPSITAMEFPLVPYVAALSYPLLGITPFSVRWLSLLSFLLIIIYVFLLTKKELGDQIAILAGFTAAILPLHHPFGRILFSEPPMIACSVAAIFHYREWLELRKIRHYIFAIIFFSLAIALKLTPLYLLIPIVYLSVRKEGFGFFKNGKIILFLLISVSLPVAWYAHAASIGKKYYDVFGIFGGQYGGHNKFQTFTMLSSFEWYRTMFYRINTQILGGKIGTLLSVIGFFTFIKFMKIRKGTLFLVYLFTIFLYFALVAEGQIDAPYRQLTIIPPISVFVATGVLFLIFLLKNSVQSFRKLTTNSNIVVMSGIVVISLIMIRNYQRIFFTDPLHPIYPSSWEFAQEIKKYATDQSKLVTVGEYTIHQGGNDASPVLYYYANIQGWTLQKGDWRVDLIEELKGKGADLFAAVRMSREPAAQGFLHQMQSKYPILYKNDEYDFLLLRLE